MKSKIEIEINFGGFYESVHSTIIENRIGMELEWENDINDTDDDITEEAWFEMVDFKETHKSYCSEYVYALNNEFDLDLEFKRIKSPRFYNFTTDKIVAEIDRQQAVNRLLPLTYDKDFIEWANPLLTSSDGFHSFYNGIDDLIKRAMDDETDFEILIGLTIDYLIQSQDFNECGWELEYEIYYENSISI